MTRAHAGIGEQSERAFVVNGRRYAPVPETYAVICLDGSGDAYIDAALAAGAVPNLERMIKSAGRFQARSAMPSYTNPNNSSIITGVPPSVHGIGGNFFLDRESGRETMMNSAEYLRVPTILAGAQRAGRRVAVVTAKDKLRAILSKGLLIGPGGGGAIGISSEKVKGATAEDYGVTDPLKLAGWKDPPNIYSADASVFVLSLGEAIVREGLADVLYLSTTDFIQHAYAPDAPEAIEFYQRIDRSIGALLDMGVVVGLTADHGMNAKVDSEGAPEIVFLESELRTVDPAVRVILPVTDPYVVHHASLGSFGVIHASSAEHIAALVARLWQLPGVTEVYTHELACRVLELPSDRTGDIVVVSGKTTVLGTKPADHDCSKLVGTLRSHGGRYEELVPLLFSHPLNGQARAHARRDPRNFDVFELTLNGSSAEESVGAKISAEASA